jgi:hypothetical protein
MFVGCGDDDGAKPRVITLADFAGSWSATEYKVTTKTVPAFSIDVIDVGGSFTMAADNAGNYTGTAVIPAELGGPVTLDFAGTIALVTQDTLQVNFNPEIPPLLTNFRAAFQLSGNTLTVIDSNTTFDFGAGEQPAIFEGTMVRS